MTLTICIVICILTMVSYIVGKIPMGLTALISMIAFILTGCLDPQTAAGLFGNTNGIMMLSMFVVAAGFNRTRFVKVVASSVNKIAKGSLVRVMFGYVLITMILSQFIQSSVVVYGLMAPMLIATCDELGISPSRVLFPIAMACISTVSALPLGSGATVFAEMNGYLGANDYTVYQVALTDPMKVRFPAMIVMFLYCVFFAWKIAPATPPLKSNALEARGDGKEDLAPFQERAGYVIFILTTLGLLFQQFIAIDTWVICFIGAVAMVLCGVLTEQEAVKAMNMPMAFLFVGSLALGSALTQTGAGEVVGSILAEFANTLSNPYLIGLVFFIVPFLLTQIMMNRTVILIFEPIAILACKALGADPVGIVLLVQSACLSSFMTPMATPAVPMCMANGGYDLKSIIKQSLIPAALLCVVSVGWIMTVFPMYH